MRRAAKVDDNHKSIVDTFRKMGCSVQSLAGVGQGVPDLLVSFGGVNRLVEVKDGSKIPSQRKLTPAQEKWIIDWPTRVYLVETTAEAMMLVQGWIEIRNERFGNGNKSKSEEASGL